MTSGRELQGEFCVLSLRTRSALKPDPAENTQTVEVPQQTICRGDQRGGTRFPDARIRCSINLA